MKHLTNIQLITTFYETAAPLLAYEECEQTRAMEKAVLGLLCRMYDRQDLEAPCWDKIEHARCLQLCSDEVLLKSIEALQQDEAIEAKLKVLSQGRIFRRQSFVHSEFVDQLKEQADMGSMAACKLLACMNWLGCGIGQNQQAALRIWSTLSVSGDTDAMTALIYGSAELGNEQQERTWTHIMDVLNKERDAFSSVARPGDYPNYSMGELEMSNIILYIIHNKRPSQSPLDRTMLQYVLDSREDYRTKMKRLASQTNFQLVLYDEDKFAHRKFGF